MGNMTKAAGTMHAVLHCPSLQEALQALHCSAFLMFFFKAHGCNLGLGPPKKTSGQLVCTIPAGTQAFRSQHRFTSSGGKNGRGAPQLCTAAPNMGWVQWPQSRLIFLYCLMTPRVFPTVLNITSSMGKKTRSARIEDADSGPARCSRPAN